MAVTETFFAIEVRDMGRATTFYTDALGAEVTFASPGWSSLRIAGVRLGLFRSHESAGGRVGLHFVVDDLDATRAAIEHAGGKALAAASEVAPGVVVAEVADSEGNQFTVRAQ